MDEQPIRVLAVDDDPVTLGVISLYLQKATYRRFVVTAMSEVDAALQTMAANIHDVYLLDFVLAQGTGHELLKRSRLLGCLGPAVLLTGAATPHLGLATMKAGFEDFLAKDNLDAEILERVLCYALERHTAKCALLERQQELMQTFKLATLGKFTSALLHDFSSPLAIILGRISGLAQLAEAKRLEPKELEVNISSMRTAAEKLLNILSNLRQYNQATAPAEAHDSDANTLMTTACDLARLRCKNLGVELRTSYLAEHTSVRCRSDEIIQVLVHLMSYAADNVAEQKSSWVEACVAATADAVHFMIIDSGEGNDADLSTPQRPFAGSGKAEPTMRLTLSLCQEIIARHGGILQTDEAERVHRILIKIPRQAAAVEKSLPKLLVVDDEPEIVELLADVFRGSGFGIFTASSGQEALEQLGQHAVDAIITDLALGDISGLQVLQTAKAKGCLPRHVYVLSGLCPPEVSVQLKSLGATLLSKPVDFDELLTLLSNAVQTANKAA